MTLLESFQWWFLWHPTPMMTQLVLPRYGVADLATLAGDTHKFESRYLEPGQIKSRLFFKIFLVGWACIVCFFCVFEKGWLCKCILSWVFLPPRLQWCLIIFVPFAIRMRPTYLCLHNDFIADNLFLLGGKGKDILKAGRMGKILSDWHHMIPRLILWDVAPTLHKIGRFSSIPRVFLVPEMAGFSEASGWTSG